MHKILKKILVIVLFVLILYNCHRVKTGILENIRNLENKYQKNNTDENLVKLISAYITYANSSHPDTGKASIFLENGARILNRINRKNDAFSLLKLSLSKFHQSKNSAKNVKLLIENLFEEKDTLNYQLAMIAFVSSYATKMEVLTYKSRISSSFYAIDSILDSNYNALTHAKVDTISSTQATNFIRSAEVINMILPVDTLSNKMLIRSAEISKKYEFYKKAIRLYDWYLLIHPDSDKAALIHLLKGEIYENNLKDEENALFEYETVANNYKSSVWNDDAKHLLKNMGKQKEYILNQAEIDRDLNLIRLD